MAAAIVDVTPEPIGIRRDEDDDKKHTSNAALSLYIPEKDKHPRALPDHAAGAGSERKLQSPPTAWTQLGNSILGDTAGSFSGSYINLSRDGSTLAVTAVYHSGGKGQVQVFKYINGSWIKRGSNINGMVPGDYMGVATLSNDGNILAVGASAGDGAGKTDNGYVRVYQYVNGDWAQLGSVIYGAADGDKFGWTISLSSDGNIMAVGAYFSDGPNGVNAGNVRVYQYVNWNWAQRGSVINGEAAEDLFGNSVSLSSDGNILAVGGYYNDGNNGATVDAGQVRVFQYVNGDWTQCGSDIDGQFAGE